MSWISSFLLRLWGFRIEGDPHNELPKRIFAVIPHTSNWDFPLGLLVRASAGIRVQYIGKASLFKPPFGFIFRMLGGHPVDRSKSTNYVQSVVDVFNTHDSLAIAVAPEGTRKKVPKLRTGFYHIARGAQVPIILTQFNFGEKVVRFSDPFYTTDDQDSDFEEIYAFFKGVEGKNASGSFIPPAPAD